MSSNPIIDAIVNLLGEHNTCSRRCAAVHLIEFVTTDIANGIDSKHISGTRRYSPAELAEYNSAIADASEYVHSWGAP
jgi:hypothetical protein